MTTLPLWSLPLANSQAMHDNSNKSLTTIVTPSVSQQFPVLTSFVGNSMPATASLLYPELIAGIHRSYASYSEQPIPELAYQDRPIWSLWLPIEVPSDLIDPTLISLSYIIKYASTCDNGSATVQADTFLACGGIEKAAYLNKATILFERADTGIYRTRFGYSPRMLDEDKALPLSVVPGIKGNSCGDQWSHYIDHQRLMPNVRLSDPKATKLFLVFHVIEYPTSKTHRCLEIEASATWLDNIEARNLKVEADLDAEKMAEEEEEKMVREEEERAAAEEAEKAKLREDVNRIDSTVAAQKAELEKIAKNIDRRERQRTKSTIEAAMRKNGINLCDQGYGYTRKEGRWECDGGGHKIPFELCPEDI